MEEVLTPEIRDLLLSGDADQILQFCNDSHPQRVAEILSGLSVSELWPILRLMTGPTRGELFSHFNLDFQVKLASGENRMDMASLIEDMAPDDRADLVQRLDPSVREEILPLVAKAEREDIRKLVSYQEDSAGSVMSTDYAVLRPETRCGEALEQLRTQASVKETIYYVYVVNEKHHLIGFVSLKDLILAKPGLRVAEVMHTDILSIDVEDDQEEAARKIEKYGLIAIPVVDSTNRLLGIITHDDAMAVLGREQTEDILAFGGVTADPQMDSGPYWQGKIGSVVKRRLHWLAILFVTEFATGTVLRSYQWVELKIPNLALFVPLLIGTGGNAGSQTVSTVIRGIALGEIQTREGFKVLAREFITGLLLGTCLGVAGFCYAMFVRGASPQFATVIGCTIAGICTWANSVGAVIPLIARRLGIDPAVVSAPLIATLVDATGLIIYYNIAILILIKLGGV